jgi:hypothetical protein
MIHISNALELTRPREAPTSAGIIALLLAILLLPFGGPVTAHNLKFPQATYIGRLATFHGVVLLALMPVNGRQGELRQLRIA